MISLKPIRENSGPEAYTRGNQIFKREKVFDMKVKEQGRLILADACVEGSVKPEYEVNLVYDQDEDNFLEYSCQCLAFYTDSGMCKHCVGVALELLRRQQEKDGDREAMGKGGPGSRAGFPGPFPQAPVPATDRAVTDWIRARSIKEKCRFFQSEVYGKVELIPTLRRDISWQVEFKIGAGHPYVVKSISSLVDAVKGQKQVEYGKKLKFYHQMGAFTPHSQKILQFLIEYVDQGKDAVRQYRSTNRPSFYQRGYDPEMQFGRYLPFAGERMVKFAALHTGRSCPVASSSALKHIRFREEDPRLKVKLKDTEEGAYRMELPPVEAFLGITRMCILMGDTIFLCSREYSEDIWELAKLLTGKKQDFWIHPNDLHSFCAVALPALNRRLSCEKPLKLSQYEPVACQIKIYLDWQDGEITAAVYGEYGEERYNLAQPPIQGQAYRDMEKEAGAVREANRYFYLLDRERGLFVLYEDQDEQVYGLVSEGILALKQVGEVYISETLKKLQVYRPPKVSVGVSLNAGVLDITLKSEGVSQEDLAGILSEYRKKKKFYRLKDGNFLSVEDNAFALMAEMAQGLELGAGDMAKGRLQVPEYRAFYLDQVLREQAGGLRVNRNRQYRALLRDFKNVEDSDFEVPEALQARLRPYQEFGYRWMCTLDKLGFGGILADDMGLGKTVQAIAFLLARRGCGQEGRYGLIVCPASLVYNWESEIRRFAPTLTVTPVVGAAAARKQLIARDGADVLLTSYDLLKRDVETYREVRFSYMIIDEAQNIKNHATQTAKAVKAVPCRRRFALTGTPIENSLSELWSIFDYLMPGILNTYKRFKENYEQPVAIDRDGQAAGRLRKMIRPFILRRLKKDVLKELPDKLEEVVFSRMGQEQRRIYDANLQQLVLSLKKQGPEEFKAGKIEVLAALTRLRQLCCDPSLAYENYSGGAAKVETCLELVRNGVAAGNQILVFSQFTQILDILKKLLEKEGVGYYLLTGATPKEKRAEMANAFNQDGTPVFLISLKAGGTGLNLTAASMVIHFDPWWNMAAQNQATDRAHRIGQKQVVTVYKLIMKDTLEEKILSLQERKARLSDDIISGGSIRGRLATKEEFMEILGE